MKKKCVVLTGAGISADSGLLTFRDAGGLWEGHKVTDVCTPEALERNPKLVIDFYNQRRLQTNAAEPNAAHKALAELENITTCTSSRRMWTACTKRRAAARFCTCTAN